LTKTKAKKELLYALADLLDKDDDLIPDDVDAESREYDSWDSARTELSRELRRRAAGAVHRSTLPRGTR
jgi:hypothetical protein